MVTRLVRVLFGGDNGLTAVLGSYQYLVTCWEHCFNTQKHMIFVVEHSCISLLGLNRRLLEDVYSQAWHGG